VYLFLRMSDIKKFFEFPSKKPIFKQEEKSDMNDGDDFDSLISVFSGLNIKNKKLKEEEKKMDKVYENLVTELKDFNEEQRIKIKKEIKLNKNSSMAFTGVGNFGEYLTTIIFPNSKGSGSKGGVAYDNTEGDFAREIKVCCLVQSKKCNNCDSKNLYFQKTCMSCQGTDFKIMKDSRFGINAKEHFKSNGVIKEYILYIIDYEDDTETIKIQCYKIMSDNEYFKNYLSNQLSKSEKSSSVNCLPFSYDFYLSGPVMLFDMELTKDGHIIKKFYDMNNQQMLNIPGSIFTSKELKQYSLKEKDTYKYEDIISKGVCIRSKKLNKSRGDVSRKI
jgi:hypothetical protein